MSTDLNPRKRVIKKRVKKKPEAVEVFVDDAPAEDPDVDPLLSVSTEPLTYESQPEPILDIPVLGEQPTPHPDETPEPEPEPEPSEPVQKKKATKKKPAKKRSVKKKKGDPHLVYLAANPACTVEQFRDGLNPEEPLDVLKGYVELGLIERVWASAAGRYSLTKLGHKEVDDG